MGIGLGRSLWATELSWSESDTQAPAAEGGSQVTGDRQTPSAYRQPSSEPKNTKAHMNEDLSPPLDSRATSLTRRQIAETLALGHLFDRPTTPVRRPGELKPPTAAAMAATNTKDTTMTNQAATDAATTLTNERTTPYALDDHTAALDHDGNEILSDGVAALRQRPFTYRDRASGCVTTLS
jgi:hypothetical protein